jgi:CubicO group peptidase (beta-lactamase class C family)
VQQVVCDVTGRPFAELMHELVLAPFGMVDSAYEQPLAPRRAGRAAVAHDDLGNPVPGGFHVYPELQAAGLWTTAVDLARWVVGVQQVLRGERSGPISTETARLMVTPVLANGAFGLGPELGGEGALRRFGHSGRNEGFNSQADGLIEAPVGGVVMATGQAASMVAEVRRALAAEYGWGSLDVRTLDVVEVDPTLLGSYTGRYAGPFGRPMRLEYADGELFSPASYGRRRMFALGDTTFVDEETGATLEVERDGTAVRRIAVLVGGAELMAFEPVAEAEEHRA